MKQLSCGHIVLITIFSIIAVIATLYSGVKLTELLSVAIAMLLVLPLKVTSNYLAKKKILRTKAQYIAYIMVYLCGSMFFTFSITPEGRNTLLFWRIIISAVWGPMVIGATFLIGYIRNIETFPFPPK